MKTKIFTKKGWVGFEDVNRVAHDGKVCIIGTEGSNLCGKHSTLWIKKEVFGLES